MTNNDSPSGDFDELDQEIDHDSIFTNSRISVRYRRNDIKVVIKTHSLLFPRLFHVDLLDISSKGLAINSSKKLSLNGRVSVYLQFNDGKRFSIIATVNNRTASRYGLKFASYQTELAEHLLSSQTELLFG